jgi:uncharacterized membrane protein YtjA (UPF0391 family)
MTRSSRVFRRGNSKKESVMRIWALILLVLSLASAYIGFYHLTGFEADAARGAAVIGLILFFFVVVFGRKKD